MQSIMVRLIRWASPLKGLWTKGCLLTLVLAALSGASQAQSFYTGQATAITPIRGTNGVPGLQPIAYGQVRVCNNTPPNTTTPCPNLATITNVAGSNLTIQGGNFGQLTTTATGMFTFGCSVGNYFIQVVPNTSNSPAYSEVVSCPVTSSGNGAFGSNSFEVPNSSGGGQYYFSSTASSSGTPDLGLCRGGVGSLWVNDGAGCNGNGNLLTGSVTSGNYALSSTLGISGSRNFTGVVKAVNAGPSTISTIVQAVVMANAFTFTGGAAGWYAAPYYSASGGFAVDTWYAFHACQNTCFTNAQIKAFADKLVTYKDGSGHLPIAVESNNTPIYYAGGDMLHNYVTGDGAFFTPQIYNLYLTLSGDVAGATANLTALNTALGLIPLDGTTHLVNVPNGTPWVPWGFHDGEQGTGNDLMGSLEFYAAQTAMAALYTAAGQSANAAAAAAAAAAVKASLQAASALWDSSDGMYYANTIQNNQIDILGSAFAAYLGVASSTQQAAIANYLYRNYLTFTLRGYVRQSPITWQYAWGSQPAQGYDNGYWSVGDEWVINTLSLVSTVAANRLASDFIGGSDPTMEWWGSGSGTFAANYAHGATSNMESPMGVMASGIVGTTFADTPATIADLIPGSLSDASGNFFGPSLSVAGAGYFGFCPAALAGVTCTPDTVMSRDSADVFDLGNAAQDTTAAVQFGIARAANGSYSAPSYTFKNCANCGMLFDIPNAALGLDYGGIEYVTLNASGLNVSIPVQSPSYRYVGTKFTASGCSNGTLLGGATGGSYVSGTSGTCTVTVTMGGSQSAPNGWTCTLHDLTTPADAQVQEGPVSTTQVTFSGTTVSGDIIVFGCGAY